MNSSNESIVGGKVFVITGPTTAGKDTIYNYLFEDENVVYIHKLILIFRLLVLEEIGLDKEINLSYLYGHLMMINNYIKSALSRKWLL